MGYYYGEYCLTKSDYERVNQKIKEYIEYKRAQRIIIEKDGFFYVGTVEKCNGHNVFISDVDSTNYKPKKYKKRENAELYIKTKEFFMSGELTGKNTVFVILDN